MDISNSLGTLRSLNANIDSLERKWRNCHSQRMTAKIYKAWKSIEGHFLALRILHFLHIADFLRIVVLTAVIDYLLGFVTVLLPWIGSLSTVLILLSLAAAIFLDRYCRKNVFHGKNLSTFLADMLERSSAEQERAIAGQMAELMNSQSALAASIRYPFNYLYNEAITFCYDEVRSGRSIDLADAVHKWDRKVASDKKFELHMQKLDDLRGSVDLNTAAVRSQTAAIQDQTAEINNLNFQVGSVYNWLNRNF